jgi:hypothetical protein
MASRQIDVVDFGSDSSTAVMNLVIPRFAETAVVVVVTPTALITRHVVSAAGLGRGSRLTLRRITEVSMVDEDLCEWNDLGREC